MYEKLNLAGYIIESIIKIPSGSNWQFLAGI